MDRVISNIILVAALATMGFVMFLVCTKGVENQEIKSGRCQAKGLDYIIIRGVEFCAEGVENEY